MSAMWAATFGQLTIGALLLWHGLHGTHKHHTDRRDSPGPVVARRPLRVPLRDGWQVELLERSDGVFFWSLLDAGTNVRADGAGFSRSECEQLALAALDQYVEVRTRNTVTSGW